MGLPPQIRAGDTVAWRDAAAVDAIGGPITSSGWALTTYLRNATAGNGLTVVASAYGTGWESTISAATSAGLAAGNWSWGARATNGSQAHTIGSGSLTILPALNYTGSASSYDGRTQSQADLEAVQATIRALVSGGAVKAYTIGSRRLEKFSLAELIELESRLKARVSRELAAERMANGLGNPGTVAVRFS